MKVLKFGGSSVATPESIGKVRSIVREQDDVVVVVVSALGGVTDELVRIAALAEAADASYLEKLQALRKRHVDTCEALAPSNKLLRLAVESLLGELDSICRGVFLLKVLPEKSRDQILSYGERLSSLIVTAAVGQAELYDSLDFIRLAGGRVDFAETNRLVAEKFAGYGKGSPVAIVPGFIARDAAGDIVTLGRGGSDYTASILASALNASVLEIWTDVDGFMSADPRIIRNAYVIDELTYEEATELCNFGAKVVYPPTLYPVCQKGIPILIKNTFNPETPGTLIREAGPDHSEGRLIKGISSIDNISPSIINAASLTFTAMPVSSATSRSTAAGSSSPAVCPPPGMI